MNNLYFPGSLPGLDSRTARVIQDLFDRVNYLTTELEMVKGRDPSVGMAKRESPQQGIITIPIRNDGGRDGQIRVNKDGVIVSYVNPVESLFPYIDISTAANSGAGLDPLHSFSLPAGSLATNGDYLTIWYGGDFAANDNDKRLVFAFGGTAYEDTGLRDLDTNTGWSFMARITRLSPTSVLVSHLIGANLMGVTSADVLVGFATGAYIFARNTPITGLSNLGTNAQTLLVQGEATANDDVIQNLSIIDLHKPRTRKFTA